MKYLLGIDFGGGASKATLLSEKGEVIASNTVEYPTYYPKQGYAEQNPDDWYNAACESIAEVLQNTKISASDIAAVCFDAATHTAVLCDENFNVLRPAIYWTDTRAKDEVRYLKENFGDLIKSQVLHETDTIWTLPQLMWVRKNEPNIFNNTKKIFFAKDYVRHQFTGDYVTDYIEAEGSMLFDYNNLCWSNELCELCGIDISILPKTVKPTDIVGSVTTEAAKRTGLCEGTPVVCGTTDTVMEVFASGGVETGNMTIKLATAGRICVVTNKAYPDKNLINYSHIVDGLWYPGTATKSCAASYRWYRDTFGGTYNDIDAAAREVEIGSGGVLFHPYLNGELTPYANPNLCASFTGVRAEHKKAHFARAVLEGVAMSMKDCMETLEKIGIPHNEKAVIIGGGGKSTLWRQIISDALGVTLITKQYSDSSFGTCMLAGIAVGIFDDAKSAVELCNKTVCETVPNMENHEKYKKLFKRYKAVCKALEPIYNGDF